MRKNVVRACVSFTVAAASVLVLAMLSRSARAEDWIDRAGKKIEMTTENESEAFAKALLSYTHPTGTNPVVSSVETARNLNGNSLTVTITLGWNGGITGANYSTVITWKCSPQKHISAVVTSDNGPFGVSTENRLRLNTYFQGFYDALFPADRK
jgi:hypothetical protein